MLCQDRDLCQEPGDLSWQVLFVRSNFEKQVARHLEVRSVEHYLPLYRERVRWTDRTVTTERALFPGYVFARFPRHLHVAVVAAPGVVRSLGEEEWNRVTDEEIEKIRAGLGGGMPLRPHCELPVGARVRIRNGNFAGTEGVVAELRQRSKVVIALGRTQLRFSLDLEREEIEVLEPHQRAPIAAF